MTSIRRAAVLALTLLAVPTVSALAQGAPQKFAYINSKEILAKAPGREAAEAKFNKDAETAQAQMQKMRDSLNTLFAEYQKIEATLTAAQKDQRQKDIQAKQQEFQKKAADLQNQVDQRQMEYMQPLMDQIRGILDAIRQEDGYSFIFDVGAEGGFVVAADRNLDITNKVVARLKPVTATAPAAKPDSTKAAPAGARAPAGVTRKPPTQ
jgi:outer membrane protein